MPVTSLPEVLISEQLAQRPERPILSTFTNAVMVELDRVLSESPQDFTAEVARAAMILSGGHSGGLSLANAAGGCSTRAAEGRWSRHPASTDLVNRHLCPLAIGRGSLLMVSRPQRAIAQLRAVYPQIEEALLVPFFDEGRPAGVVWAAFHTDQLQFDIHDGYMLQELARLLARARTRLLRLGHW